RHGAQAWDPESLDNPADVPGPFGQSLAWDAPVPACEGLGTQVARIQHCDSEGNRGQAAALGPALRWLVGRHLVDLRRTGRAPVPGAATRAGLAGGQAWS